MHQVERDKFSVIRDYDEVCLAAQQFEKEFKCIAAPATDKSRDIFIWTHATFIDKVAYFPFQYKFLDLHRCRMVYADGYGNYVSSIYYD